MTLLQALERFDDYAVERISQPFCDGFTAYTGRSNFFFAWLCGWAALGCMIWRYFEARHLTAFDLASMFVLGTAIIFSGEMMKNLDTKADSPGLRAMSPFRPFFPSGFVRIPITLGFAGCVVNLVYAYVTLGYAVPGQWPYFWSQFCAVAMFYAAACSPKPPFRWRPGSRFAGAT